MLVNEVMFVDRAAIQAVAVDATPSKFSVFKDQFLDPENGHIFGINERSPPVGRRASFFRCFRASLFLCFRAPLFPSFQPSFFVCFWASPFFAVLASSLRVKFRASSAQSPRSSLAACSVRDSPVNPINRSVYQPEKTRWTNKM